MDIKKIYNHTAIESNFLKTDYFQKLYASKKGKKRENVNTQLPILISKDTSLESISELIKESVVATYQNMKGIKAKLLPIFDTEKKDLTIKNYENILTKAGIFFGIDTDNMVYSERNTNFVRNLFVQLVNEGHIYEDYSINYRSIEEQKTLGIDEIQWELTKTKEYNIRYFVDTKNISLIVPTLRPETIFADIALAVHPDDKRYKKLLKSKVIIPIINKTIPIITDEEVNPMQGTGIMRITPAHDTTSLMIAQKHNLKIDTYAIDKKGCFTKNAGDFCGKEAKEFVKNIIKNLDDIHNLESVTQKEVEIAVHKKTGEKALPLLCNQLFINTEKEKISEIIEKKQIQILPKEQETEMVEILENMRYRPVTKEDNKGYNLPQWKSKNNKSYFISDNEIINLPARKNKNKLTVLSLILFNLIADKRLKQHFSIEECIDILLSKNLTGKQTTLETYIELFSETLPKGYSKELVELKKIFEYTQKEKGIANFEKFSGGLTAILDKSVAIYSKRKGFYSFDIDIVCTNDEGLVQQKEKIESTLGNALILIKMMEAFHEKKHEPKKICHITENKILEFLKTIIIGESVQKKLLFDECRIHKEMKTNKRKKEDFKETIKHYGIDCTRMYAIDPEIEIEKYTQFITKLWNASRFINQHLYEKKGIKKISDLKQLTQYLEKKKKDFTEFEGRIIYKITELQKEYEEAIEKNTLPYIQKKMIEIIKNDFCDKYIEIYKQQNTDNAKKIALRGLGNILKLLHPFIPFVTQQIRQTLGLEGPIFQQQFTESFTSISKNYKTQLFMDIIDKFLEMKYKEGCAKHDKVDICFFAPLDFLQYLRKQENILTTLINTTTINYLENEKELTSYRTENIINITIGIKTQRKKLIEKESENLNETLRKKEKELQNIRTIISGLSANGTDPDIIRAKKRDMNKLKKEIEELQYHIQKQKIRK